MPTLKRGTAKPTLHRCQYPGCGVMSVNRFMCPAHHRAISTWYNVDALVALDTGHTLRRGRPQYRERGAA
jgi:hypothetical protein